MTGSISCSKTSDSYPCKQRIINQKHKQNIFLYSASKESTDRYDGKASNTYVPNGFAVQLQVVVSHFIVVSDNKLMASVHVTRVLSS